MPDVRAFVFDAYGTLFDVQSVVAACREVTPDPEALSREWRAKQLEYTWLRALMGRYEDFWDITRSALGFALKHLRVEATKAQVDRLMAAYLSLSPFPEVPDSLKRLHTRYPLAILSNGSPRMLQAAVESSGLQSYLQHVLSAKAFGFQVVWCNRAQAPLDELGVAPDATVTRLNEVAGALRLS
jgi:2-haloacid dehalogenase